MKTAYPIVMSKGDKHIVVYIPDFNINTQGTDYANAIEMARDAIGIMGIDMEDEKKPIPIPSEFASIKLENTDDVVSLVDVDFTEYRKAHDNRTVRRNITLPSWLNDLADKSGVNVSGIAQKALKAHLQVSE